MELDLSEVSDMELKASGKQQPEEAEMMCRIGSRVVKSSIEAIRKAFVELGETASGLELHTLNVEGEDKHVGKENAFRKIGFNA
jgi:hypothetical protein